jgi:hypothetical protein
VLWQAVVKITCIRVYDPIEALENAVLQAVATVLRKPKDPHNKAIAVISTQAGWDEEGRVHLPAIISTQAGSNEEGRQGHLPGRTGSSESTAKATWGKLRMAGRNINVIQYMTLISNLNRLFMWSGMAPGGISL